MSLLPSRPDVSADAGPRVVGVDSEDADALMSALSSDTARQVLSELHDEPAPPAEVADRVDTSLQNAQYHLANLEDAGAIQVVGTAYSEKGREMDVYAPADEPLVIFAGGEEQAGGLRTALSRLLGGVAVLAVGAVAVQEVLGRGVDRLVPSLGSQGGGPPAGPAATATPTPTDAIGGAGTPTATARPTPTGPPDATATPTAMDTAAGPATDVGAGAIPPGLVFFLGGLGVLVAGVAWTYYRG